MSVVKSDNSDLTINASGSTSDIKFQANGVEKASISSTGAFTSTTIDATKLTGDLPAISGASLTSLTSGNLTGDLPAISGASLTNLPGGDNTPSFYVTLSANQTLTDGAYTKINWNTESWDSNNAFASNKFTVPTGEGGKYLFVTKLYADNVYTGTNGRVALYVNGSIHDSSVVAHVVGHTTNLRVNGSHILELSAGDYVETYFSQNASTRHGSYTNRVCHYTQSYFSGIKLIGV